MRDGHSTSFRAMVEWGAPLGRRDFKSYRKVVPMQPAIAVQKADRTKTPNMTSNMAFSLPCGALCLMRTLWHVGLTAMLRWPYKAVSL